MGELKTCGKEEILFKKRRKPNLGSPDEWEGLRTVLRIVPGSGAVVMDGNSDPGHAQL